MVKVQLLDSILHPDLHLGVGRVACQEASGAGAGDVDVRRHASCLGSLCILNAKIVVDFPLVLDAACGGAGGANRVEDDIRLG